MVAMGIEIPLIKFSAARRRDADRQSAVAVDRAAVNGQGDRCPERDSEREQS